MPVDTNGNYSLPPGYLAVTGQKVLASQHNPPLEDIAAALSQVLYRSGVAPMLGPLNMNGFTLVGLGESSDGTAPATNAQLAEVVEMVRALVPPGSILPGRWVTPPAGYVLEDGGTIGSVASNATNRANADTSALYTHLWNSFSNTLLPIQSSSGVATTRGASAAADFAANKRLPLFDSRTRFLRGSDSSLGFDATLTVGASKADGIKNHKHPGTTAADGGHTPTIPRGDTGGGVAAQNGPSSGSGNVVGNPVPDHTHTFTTNDNTGGLALETRPRATVVLFCIKL
jgi:hypothetical protein